MTEKRCWKDLGIAVGLEVICKETKDVFISGGRSAQGKKSVCIVT
jgi:hypothetical protein